MAQTVDVTEWSIWEFIHKTAWWRNRGILTLNILLLIPLMTSVVNGLDSSLINGLQILPSWKDYFHQPEGRRLGLIISAQFLGNLSFLPAAPYLSDILGRRMALCIGSIIMCIGVGLQTSALNIPMFIGARYCIGAGLAFCQNAAPLLLIELAYPTQRGQITCMFNSCWYFGSIISAWVCLGAFQRAGPSQWSWRVPVVVQALFPVIQIITVWFMPESPRWLISKGMESRAAAVLVKYHARGRNEHDPLVMFEMAQIRHAIRMEEEINRSTSYLSLFKTSGNRKRMKIILAIAIFSQWSGNGLVSYYIDLVLKGVGVRDTATKSIVNGCLQIYNFIIAMGAAILVEHAGRRPLFLVSNIGMLAALCACTVTTALYQRNHNFSAARATIPFIFIYFFFYNLAYSPMLVAYALEILPFRTRAKGFAVMNIAIMAAVAFNQFVNPWALKAMEWRYYVVYCVWLLVELIFVFFFVVETKGRTLEETASLFDGNEKSTDLAAMGGVAATMSIRLTTVVDVVVDGDLVTSIDTHSSTEKQGSGDYYQLKRQYQSDSDSTSSNSGTVQARAL
ncbi:general substrate transporter [Pholiota conissans]|uniref:General substrate transporter n=1 Tax=Pholiota conissans TaxID=109636 RepID=A0A9P6CQS8_9AGAR|nr:general substrate transporter [Pholiota conissans]